MTDGESEETRKYVSLMQKSMDCYKAGDMKGFKEYSSKANAIYNSAIDGMSADETKGEEKIEPGDGETVTKTTVTRSKNNLSGDMSPEEEELLSSVTGKGGLKGETTPEEDEMLRSVTDRAGLKGETTDEEEEMLDNAASILKGVMGKWI